MAGWIKMALGMEVGLGPGHIALYGDSVSSPPQRGEGRAPKFSVHVIVIVILLEQCTVVIAMFKVKF